MSYQIVEDQTDLQEFNEYIRSVDFTKKITDNGSFYKTDDCEILVTKKLSHEVISGKYQDS